MARLNKIDFPKPNIRIIGNKNKIDSHDSKKRYKAMRNISDVFIKRVDVRTMIMDKCDSKCTECGATDNLTVDHIISVYDCSIGKCEFEFLNSYDNLQILCRSCNSKK